MCVKSQPFISRPISLPNLLLCELNYKSSFRDAEEAAHDSVIKA